MEKLYKVLVFVVAFAIGLLNGVLFGFIGGLLANIAIILGISLYIGKRKNKALSEQAKILLDRKGLICV